MGHRTTTLGGTPGDPGPPAGQGPRSRPAGAGPSQLDVGQLDVRHADAPPGQEVALYPEAPRRPPAVRDQRHPALVRNYLRLRDHLGDPLFRNAYALMVNTGVTGLLGVTYWLLAARHYAVADVGRASAAYTAMNLLAGFTALNLTGALTRFIPQSGRRTAAFIIRAYAGSCVASVVVAIPFLLTVRHWGSSYAELAGSATGLIFIACVVTWSIFTLQDGVLTGLRSAIWIPFENGLFGIVKIVLLVSLAVAIPHSGIYVSWMLPVAVSLPLINILIFGRLVPRHAAATSRRAPPTGRQIRRFLAGDYTGALCVLATTTLVPVTVALRIDPGMYAYFYMAWMIGSTLDLFAVNMATSLTVEGAFDAARLAVNCRAALRKIMLILVPIAGALALISPWALGLFGPNYAEHGARILELLAAAALPKALTEVYLGALRAQSRTSLIALIQGVRCILVLGLALGLTGLVGIVGAAMAVLASQAIVAVMITPGLRRILAGARRAPLPLRPEGRYLLSVEPLSVGSAGSPEQETVTAGGLGGREASPPQASTPVVQQAVQPEEPVTEVAAARSRIRIMRPGWLPVAALCALAAAGLALFFLPLRGVSLSRMTGLGLISVLPAASLIGVGMLTLAFVLALGLPRARPAVLGAMLVGIVICLDGVTAIIEPEPRFATAYQIAGFVEYISRTGHSAPGVGAYFSWPGFFALVAFLQGVAGNHDLIPVLRFWPVLIDLLCLLPLFLIMRNLRATWRARWFAAFLFSAGNWVGQDYFSPQAFNFLLYLVFVAILLTWFGRVPRGARAPDGRAPDGRAPDGRAAGPAGNAAGLGRAIRRRWRDAFSLLVPGELPSRPVGGATRAMLLTLLIGIFVISTASHQLTPFFMVTACAGLVAARRCRLTGLPVLLGVILVGWVSFAAVGYWSGHLSDIFGGIGHLGANITSSVTGRVSGPKAGGTSPSHRPVLYARAAVAAVVMVMAAYGLLRRRHWVVDDRAVLVLTCAPFLSLGLQSYGGEISLRIYLFALPAASLLAAYLFFPAPQPGRRAWRSLPAVAICALVLVPAFFVARYGNEAFERIPSGELTAFDYLYAHDSAGARLVWLSPEPVSDNTPQMPWESRDIEKIDFIPTLAPRDPASVAGLVATLRALGPGSYLMTTSTQETYLQQEASFPSGWSARFRADMGAAAGVRTVFANGDAVIYTLSWPPGTARQPLNVSAAGSPVRATFWTPVGLVVLGLLLLVLVAREFIRVCLGAPRRLIRPLTLASLPLLMLLLVVVIERFIVLS